jgi:hypothetical protein
MTATAIAAPSTAKATSAPLTLGHVARIFVRYPSPRILLTATATCIVARLLIGEWRAADAAIVAAILAAWPLIEWLIHVFILHYKPATIFGHTFDFPVPRSHRAHHRDPDALALVFIPTHVFAYAVPLQLVLWFGLLPTAGLALTGLAFYFAMALKYEWFHYLIHTRYRPRSRYYERRWRNHRLHHYKNEHCWFGVSTIGGDRLLGTAPSFQSVPTSPTCRTLGLETSLGA